MKGNLKRSAAALALLLLLSSLLSLFSACMPKTDDLRERVEWLLTESQEINEVLWGKGLPVWTRDSEFAKENHIYDDFEEDDYLFVSDESRYLSASSIKTEAERYYAKEFLEKSVYPQTFDGIAIDDGMGYLVFAKARFYDDGDWFYQYKDAENYFANGSLTYDFSTMKVVRPSNKNTCYVTISATLGSEMITQRVKLQKQNGEWYLASAVG